MITVYIIRAFGGVLILQVSPVPPPTTNATFYVRKGNATFNVRI